MLVVRVESATQSASLDACGARSCAVVEGGRQVDDMTMVVVWVGDRRYSRIGTTLYSPHTPHTPHTQEHTDGSLRLYIYHGPGLLAFLCAHIPCCASALCDVAPTPTLPALPALLSCVLSQRIARQWGRCSHEAPLP